ncbi:MAG: hypothetical protein AAF702_41975 [Chloroflexota bacterium]
MFFTGTPLWLLNVGSFFLGVTLAIVILCIWGSRTNGVNRAESCLISLIGLLGFSLSMIFYSSAALL